MRVPTGRGAEAGILGTGRVRAGLATCPRYVGEVYIFGLGTTRRVWAGLGAGFWVKPAYRHAETAGDANMGHLHHEGESTL